MRIKLSGQTWQAPSGMQAAILVVRTYFSNLFLNVSGKNVWENDKQNSKRAKQYFTDIINQSVSLIQRTALDVCMYVCSLEGQTATVCHSDQTPL
jgi:hypothetical protein